MYFEESSKCGCTSATNTHPKFYGKITGMTLHLSKLPLFFKATIRTLLEILKSIVITEKQNHN